MNAQTQTTAVAKVQPRSVLIDMSARYGMEPAAFEQTLRATVVPKDCTREQFAAFLLVAREYNLNPMTKEIYAFPSRGGIQPIVSVDGWLNLVNSHPQANGIEFDDHIDQQGKVTAITARIWRKDREKPIVVTEYMIECVRDTDTWKKYPRRMLRHKALIQCARYAFGFAGIVDPDEAERIRDTGPRTASHDDGPPAPPAMESYSPPQAEDPAIITVLTPEPPPPDDLEIPAALDRRPKAQTAPAQFDGAQWLKDLEGALSGCGSLAEHAKVLRDVMNPEKARVSREQWDRAQWLSHEAYKRITETVLDAG